MSHAFYNQTSGKFIGTSDINGELFIPITSVLHINGVADGIEFILSSGRCEQYLCDVSEFLTAYKNFLNE